ncbi:DNA repair protein RadC [Candidatus Methanophagaceae archaeon]|nr:DNA repair protein RadC [Methanophagales archaeon]
MEISPDTIKDVERLQRYERIVQKLVKTESFSKSDIWACGESKGLIGKIINLLLSEGSIVEQEKGIFLWMPAAMAEYKKEWVTSMRPSHQLKRLRTEERPREKLLYGYSKPTTAELLAIFLRSGIPGKSAIVIANDLLTQFGGVKGIFEADKTELMDIAGVGAAKVAQIKAVQALAEEYLKEKMKSVTKVKNSKEVFDYLYLTMRDLKTEIFKVIFLDSANQTIDAVNLFEGTLNASSVYPREIVKSAVNKNAASLIFAHNHPSGDPTPSGSDRAITEDLVYACNLVQITVLDHIIIGDNVYFSFADEGLLEEYNRNYVSIKERRGRPNE